MSICTSLDLYFEMGPPISENQVKESWSRVVSHHPSRWGTRRYRKFDHVLISSGFFINDVDKCIYSKVENNSCIIICLYVDNMLMFGTNLQFVIETKCFLRSEFDMKDLG